MSTNEAETGKDVVVKPWYRQFWPWFIIALPATSVVAGLSTLGIAIRNQDSLVRDDWYKDGKAINQSLERDNVAKAHAITAELKIDNITGEIGVTLSAAAGFKLPQSLTLNLSHPTLASQDQTLTLLRHADGQYHGVLKQGLRGRYYLELSTPEWRLNSSRDFPLDKLTLLHE